MKDDDTAPETPPTRSEPSPTWPSMADGRSGVRGKGEAAAEPEPTAGRPYELRGPMGRTAYGRAFRARHVPTGREVALHYLSIGDEAARDLPLAVAKCAQISHPTVIALEEHGYDPDEGAYYLVTEPLEGISLADQLEDERVFTLERALSIARHVGRALWAAHKLGIVHGALSPTNVRLVRNESGAELARVVGFGCAAFEPERSPVPSRGSPLRPYEAPELARGAAPDARADLFALGALLYRMLTGVWPKAMPGGPPPSLAAASEEPVPRELDELVASCLEGDPAARFGDSVAVTRRLREIAQSVHGDEPLEPLSSGDGSVPPLDLGSGDNEVSGSILGAEGSGYRSGFVWIVLGLALALLAVWLVWDASVRGHPAGPTRPLRASEAP